MTYLQNLHTHTTYCDGKDTPTQMIESAISQCFDSIGFSGHSFTFYSQAIPMSIEGTEEYKKEITVLKEKYAGKIDLFLGLEFDMYSGVDLSGYDYLLGSVHVMKYGDQLLFIDWNAERTRENIEKVFGGDGIAYAKHYFEAVADLPNHGRFDILAHFDLVTKFNEKEPDLFDTQCEAYHAAATAAAEALVGKVEFFEVNTGAISRGYRTTPYPDPYIIQEMHRLGFKAIISSDCHDRNFLDCGYEQAKQLLRAAGFTEHYVLQEDGFVPVPLES